GTVDEHDLRVGEVRTQGIDDHGRAPGALRAHLEAASTCRRGRLDRRDRVEQQALRDAALVVGLVPERERPDTFVEERRNAYLVVQRAYLRMPLEREMHGRRSAAG